MDVRQKDNMTKVDLISINCFPDCYSALTPVIKDELQLLFCTYCADTVAFVGIFEMATGATAGNCPIYQPLTSYC